MNQEEDEEESNSEVGKSNAKSSKNLENNEEERPFSEGEDNQ